MGKTLDYRPANPLYFSAWVSRKILGNRVSAIKLTMPPEVLRWHPLAIMRDQRGEVLAKPIGQKQRGTVWRQHPGDLMDEALRHGQGAIPDVDGQDELAHGVHRNSDPLRGS